MSSAARTSQTHTPTMIANPGMGEGALHSREILVSPTTGNHFWKVGRSERGETFLFAIAAVIDNYGGTGAEMQRDGRIDIYPGDTLMIEGKAWLVEVERYSTYYLRLVPVPPRTK